MQKAATKQEVVSLPRAQSPPSSTVSSLTGSSESSPALALEPFLLLPFLVPLIFLSGTICSSSSSPASSAAALLFLVFLALPPSVSAALRFWIAC